MIQNVEQNISLQVWWFHLQQKYSIYAASTSVFMLVLMLFLGDASKQL